jgi:hypothetical protein
MRGSSTRSSIHEWARVQIYQEKGRRGIDIAIGSEKYMAWKNEMSAIWRETKRRAYFSNVWSTTVD